MKTITVKLKDKSYPIYIDTGLRTKADLLRQHIHGEKVLLVSNDQVMALYGNEVKTALGDFQYDEIILPEGEQYKSLATLNQIFDRLLEQQHPRSTTLIALGGGVIGDMTGFAAACYMRGVNFLQIPTTLLAQVDASIGGKTAVNHPLGKNMIGAFYQPQCVLIDTDTLSSLSARDFAAGLAEIIKAALIADQDFFVWLEKNLSALLKKDKKALVHAIDTACKIKVNIVEEDEKEHGVRAWLNLGHTFAHGLERITGYKTLNHGEAVAVGLYLAAKLARERGTLNDIEVERIKAILTAAGLPTDPPSGIQYKEWLDAIAVDKKFTHGTPQLILPNGLGQVAKVNIKRDELERFLAKSLTRGNA